jgi:hypothetical protein
MPIFMFDKNDDFSVLRLEEVGGGPILLNFDLYNAPLLSLSELSLIL